LRIKQWKYNLFRFKDNEIIRYHYAFDSNPGRFSHVGFRLLSEAVRLRTPLPVNFHSQLRISAESFTRFEAVIFSAAAFAQSLQRPAFSETGF